MSTLSKSSQLSRLRVVIVLIVVFLLITLLLRFYQMTEASLEEVAVNLNIISMQQMMHDQSLLTATKDPKCSYLEKPDLLQTLSPITADQPSAESTSGHWYYDVHKNQLTYKVKSTLYFRSDLGKKVVIELYCNKGIVRFKVNRFQWCHNKTISGCSQW
jgi:hypothetical protein